MDFEFYHKKKLFTPRNFKICAQFYFSLSSFKFAIQNLILKFSNFKFFRNYKKKNEDGKEKKSMKKTSSFLSDRGTLFDKMTTSNKRFNLFL